MNSTGSFFLILPTNFKIIQGVSVRNYFRKLLQEFLEGIVGTFKKISTEILLGSSRFSVWKIKTDMNFAQILLFPNLFGVFCDEGFTNFNNLFKMLLRIN